MSEEGGFDELEEFFSDLASFSSSYIRRLSSSAIFTAASSTSSAFLFASRHDDGLISNLDY
jgi:hypothetical protein